MSKFIIASQFVKKNKRYNTRAKQIDFKIKSIPKKENPDKWVTNALKDVVAYATTNLLPQDKIGVSFCGTATLERNPGWLSFRNVKDFKTQDVLNMITNIFQSNTEGLNTETFCLSVTTVRMPQGKGRVKNEYYNTFDEECVARKGIITIDGSGNLCLPRAIVVGIARLNKEPEFKNLRQSTKQQTKRSKVMLKEAEVEIPEEGAGITELKKLQQFLKNEYTIVVYQYGTGGKDVIFSGDTMSTKKINLLYHKGHYNLITSLTSTFSCVYFCDSCNIPYFHKGEHRCAKSCPCCQTSPPCEPELNIICNKCNRRFRSQKCFENHNGALCNNIKKCVLCLKTQRKGKYPHKCGEVFCKTCGTHAPENHYCFMRPDTKSPKLEKTLYIFFDLETQQDMNKNEVKEHIPNLCVFQLRCSDCIEIEVDLCTTCDKRENVLQENIIHAFMDYILKIRKKFKNVIVIAHNGQSFDHQFILNHVLTKTSLTPQLIMRGTKIIKMKIGNTRFIDSLSYFPMALNKLPKAFDLPATFKKGYFPHFFNTLQNENYVGAIPSIDFYGCDSMLVEERKDFLKWYKSTKNKTFDLKKELTEYCISDVNILTQACLKFRKMFLDECNVEPFLEAATIPSACSLVFKRNFLRQSTIGLIPASGYRFKNKHSKVAIKWLIYMEDQYLTSIQHAAKGNEAKLHGTRVDGYSADMNQVFEFYGCYYHGCPTCFQTKRDDPLHDDKTDTFNLRYENTLSRAERLKSFGYELIEIWECQFKAQKKDNEKMDYLDNHPMLNGAPLEPRDAFYGGRTGNTVKYYKCKKHEKIQYIDVCSLYPFVCKYGEFPVGHPEVILDRAEINLKNMSGLIKCKILPPENLIHPVLPMKQNNKLMFSLCKTCSETKSKENECPHNDEDRALLGTWVIAEVIKALQKGYKIMEVFEIWKYKTERNYQKGLFSEMMNKFIKLKQQASGWPSHCTDEISKQKYIEDYKNNEGITLEAHKIVSNPGLRSLSKLMLNSFWGKFGEDPKKQKTEIVNSPDIFYNLLTNPSIEVCNILPVNDENIILHWRNIEEIEDILPSANVAIAAYVTAQARLCLYAHLEKLENRVLYYDTDSVFYVAKPNEYDPPTGEFVGDMTNELECYGKGSYITEFVSGGPKNYAYKVFSTNENDEKTVCKVKGIRINYTTSQKINFTAMKNLVELDENAEIKIDTTSIRRTNLHAVITAAETKKYRIKAEKRQFLEDFSSVPYGFKRQK